MKTVQNVAAGAALIAALAGGGVYLAMAAPDGAATSTRLSASENSKGGHRANGITEQLLTGDTAARVEAAALTANPGATVLRVETDAEGAAYEAHIRKADGTTATVKFDASFNVTATESGTRS